MRDNQIRRDRSNLHFGPPRRRGISPLLLVVWTLTMLVVGYVAANMEQLQGEVNAAFLGPPTATPPASSVANDAYAAYMDGDMALAEQLFARATELEPANVDVLYEYARVLILRDRPQDALIFADRAVELAPNDPRGYAAKTYALFLLDRVEEAVPVGLSGLEVDSDYAPIYAALAWVYVDLGRWSQGLDMAERAISTNPNDVDARRAYAYTLLFTGRPDLAARQLEAAIALHERLDVLYFELAMAYRAQENEPAAITAYQRVLDMQPENVQAMVRMCETYFSMRQDQLAQFYCEEALDYDNDLARAWRQVGMIYYTRRNYESAIDAFETCVNLGSTDIECWYLRGLAHYRLDQCDQGVPVLQEAYGLTDDDGILLNIRQGLFMCAEDDPNYDLSIMPTEAPTPTPVPTPIGIF